MNDTSDIIADLLDTSLSLEQPLLKAKVLAMRLENLEFQTWVEKEINGYGDPDSYPEYRIAQGNVVANIVSGSRALGFTQIKDYEINLSGLGIKENRVKEFSTIEIIQGIKSIEKLAGSENGQSTGRDIPTNIRDLVHARYQRVVDPMASIMSLRMIIPSEFPQQIISNVRNRMLEVMVALES